LDSHFIKKLSGLGWRKAWDHQKDQCKGGKTMKQYEILLALAEEDLHSTMAIYPALEKKGYQITTEARSDFNTERIPVNDFDLVITDLLAVLEKAKEFNLLLMIICLNPLDCQNWKCGSPIALKNSKPIKRTYNPNHAILPLMRRFLTW
jgi:hypothetical protein